MANTLYELLEVAESASPEAIAASYQRLREQIGARAANGDEDATNRLIALREAFSTVSDPARRKRYDDRLAARSADAEAPQPSASPVKWLALAALIGISTVGYMKYQAEREQTRLESERAERAAAEKMAETEARKAQEAEQQRLRNEAAERASRERDIAYGNQVTRNIQRAEAQANWDRQREEQQKSAAERQQQYDADRQLAREKAYLRKLEAENARYPRY